LRKDRGVKMRRMKRMRRRGGARRSRSGGAGADFFFIEMGKPQSFQYTEEEEEARGGDARRPEELAR
jgi:hypothetical protein